jgi:hypothetical protein
LKAIVSKLSDPLKTKLSELLLKATDKKKVLVAFVKQKLKITNKTNSSEEIDFTDLQNEDNEFEVTTKDNNGIEGINDDDINDGDIKDINDDDIKDIINIISNQESETTEQNMEQKTSDVGTEEDENGKRNEEQQYQQNQSNTTGPEQNVTKSKETKETKKEVSKETKEIDTSDMLKVALASNYFTQYGILSGMLKMNQEKDNNKFDVMKFVQDPKLYAEFCNKMGFQFAEVKEDTNVDDNKNSDTDSEEEKEE